MSDLQMVLNLIRKDLKIGKYILLIMSGWWIFLIFLSNARAGVPVMISAVLLFQALVLDDQYRTGKFLVSLPLKRSSIVLARYGFALLVLVLMPVVSYVLGLLLNALMPLRFDQVYPLKNFVYAEMMVVLFVCLAYPVHFRYGSNLDSGMKALAAVFVLTFLLLLTGALLVMYFNLHLKMGDRFFFFITGLGLAGLVASLFISLRIFNKREF